MYCLCMYCLCFLSGYCQGWCRRCRWTQVFRKPIWHLGLPHDQDLWRQQEQTRTISRYLRQGVFVYFTWKDFYNSLRPPSSGGRTSQAIVDGAMNALRALVKERLSGSSGSSGYSKQVRAESMQLFWCQCIKPELGETVNLLPLAEWRWE